MGVWVRRVPFWKEDGDAGLEQLSLSAGLA